MEPETKKVVAFLLFALAGLAVLGVIFYIPSLCVHYLYSTNIVVNLSGPYFLNGTADHSYKFPLKDVSMLLSFSYLKQLTHIPNNSVHIKECLWSVGRWSSLLQNPHSNSAWRGIPCRDKDPRECHLFDINSQSSGWLPLGDKPNMQLWEQHQMQPGQLSIQIWYPRLLACVIYFGSTCQLHYSVDINYCYAFNRWNGRCIRRDCIHRIGSFGSYHHWVHLFPFGPSGLRLSWVLSKEKVSTSHCPIRWRRYLWASTLNCIVTVYLAALYYNNDI